jgi:AcrR family transcriptional regulator
VRRTRRSLVEALVALVRQKSYNAITVQDLLDHADVGRSTFYAHYRGKDDLLLKSFERLVTTLDEHMDLEGPTTRVAPVRELFAHVGRMADFYQALVRARVIDHQAQGRTDHFARLIERRLAARPGEPGGAVPLPVRARALAGALFALLQWWVERRPLHTPEQMDEMFHAIWARDAGAEEICRTSRGTEPQPRAPGGCDGRQAPARARQTSR